MFILGEESDRIEMSQRERDRLKVLYGVIQGERPQKEAARLLRLTVSIGSNDLIQYVMAADRDNPKVAHLCEPFSPPIMRLLWQVIRACRRHDKPVTLCGEMAGRPRCFLPLFGMGLRR